MIHSTNLVISNVLIKDIPNFYTKFKKYNKNGCYYYKFKGCTFYYFLTSRSLYIITDTHKILGTITTKTSDSTRFIEKLKAVIAEVTTLTAYELKVCRIDYYVDLKLNNEEEVNEILFLLHKYSTKYKYMKQKKVYKTSIHLTTKNGSYNINFYDKYKQLQDTLGIEDERFKNTIRFELQIKSRKIKKLEKYQNIQRDIKNYFSKSLMEQLYFKTLENYFYKGDYVTLSEGINIIKKSNYTQTIKLNLIKFLKVVNILGITYTKKYFSYNAIRKYINLLNELKINPICLSDNSRFCKINNLLQQLKRIAEETYFK